MGVEENKLRITLYVDRAQLIDIIDNKSDSNEFDWYERCKTINNLLVSVFEKITPELLKINSKDEFIDINEIYDYCEKFSNGYIETMGNSYWQCLHNSILHVYEGIPITYGEYRLFTFYFKKGHKMYNKTDGIRFVTYINQEEQ